MTRAIDIDCPNAKRVETFRAFGVTTTCEVGCGARVGEYCNGTGIGADLCQARINAAVKKTRDANRARRARKP